VVLDVAVPDAAVLGVVVATIDEPVVVAGSVDAVGVTAVVVALDDAPSSSSPHAAPTSASTVAAATTVRR
jgi:hypothetical protein